MEAEEVVDEKEEVERLIKQLGQDMTLKVVHKLENLGDEGMILAWKVRYTRTSFELEPPTALIREVVQELDLEHAREVDTPGLRPTTKKQEQAMSRSDCTSEVPEGQMPVCVWMQVIHRRTASMLAVSKNH